MAASGRSFLIRHPDKSYGRATTDDDYGDPSIEDDVEVPKNNALQDVAKARGNHHISRLAALADKDSGRLDLEIKALTELRGQQIEGLKAVYGDTGEGLAAEWMRRGSILAHTNSDRNYRSRAVASFPSLDGDDDDSIDLHGWDETVQTAIVRERVKGRNAALSKFSAHPQFDKLQQIHELMTQSSSLSRVPTAGVAGSLDAVDGTFGAHTTEKAFGGGGVGTNPMGHRDRTAVMQAAEADLLAASPDATMAEIQRVRLASSLVMTTNSMSAKSIPNVTNKDVFSRATNPELKGTAMHWGREAAKTMQRSIVSAGPYAPSPPASPTATRKTVAEHL